MRIAPLALAVAMLLGNPAFAESPIPMEVVNPEKLAAQNPVGQVGNIVSDSMTPGAAAPLPVNMPEEQQLLLKMAQKAQQSGSPDLSADQGQGGSLAEIWAEKVKSKYAPTQTISVRPSGNVMVPVSLGLMNRFETNFTNVAVKTSDETAVLEVDGGVLYVTINSRDPVGLILMEEGVPDSAINITAVPVDVPPALVRVTVPMSAAMRQDAFDFQRKNKDAELVDKAMSEEAEIVRSDRHTERVKEILKYTALGQVPAGFTMADTLDEVPAAYKHPCQLQSLTNTLGQRMIGAREFIDVVLVTNKTGHPAVIKEEMCMSRDTIAVGVMDAASLKPGASTEVYVVRDKNWAKKQQQLQTRPRLDNNGNFGLTGYQRVVGGAPMATSPSGIK